MGGGGCGALYEVGVSGEVSAGGDSGVVGAEGVSAGWVGVRWEKTGRVAGRLRRSWSLGEVNGKRKPPVRAVLFVAGSG